MKNLKNILKPFYAIFIFLAIGFISLVKKGILVFKIKPQYKNIEKLSCIIQKLYSLVFNPYRISNGIRPSFGNNFNVSFSDIERCHEIIHQRRQEA